MATPRCSQIRVDGSEGLRQRTSDDHEQRTSSNERKATRTELVWAGKYDGAGRRVAPLRVALPFQTVETINESAADREQYGLLAGQPGAGETAWRNRLVWGDKKYVLPSLLPEFAGKVNLIYIDPPFDTGADFSFTATVPDYPETEEDDSFAFTKEPSIIEQKAYRDTWGRGLDSYLQWFYETAVLLHELLHETGSLYTHLDYHVAHYAKAVMDEVFGQDRFVNEIVWRRTAAHNDPGRFGNIHDVVFFYSKTDIYAWNDQFTPHSEDAITSSFIYGESSDGKIIRLGKGQACPQGYRRFQTVTLRSPHPRPNLRYEYKGYKPHPNGWSCNRARMEQYDREGRLFYPSSKEGALRLKMYLDESPGVPLQDLWIDVKKLEASSLERVGYETQKPEALLERVIKACSNEDDLVLDCFCGSGTTAAVAEKLNRRWIACDLGRFAIHVTRKRLLSIPGVRPFVVQNLGKYERQLWQEEQFRVSGIGSREEMGARQREYVEFILRLYNAKPIHGYTWLHGVKGGRMVHVGAVDSPVSLGDVTQIAAEFRRAVGTGKDAPTTNGVDVLGWDFAFEINEVAKQHAAAANIQMKFMRIPRDVMDRRAVEQGDIHFFELAALSVETKVKERSLTLRLKDFVIPPDDVPEDVRRAVRHWSQWIDYWAVDWDNKGDTFHNQWQTYRTRKENTLALETTHEYDAPGEYLVVVKVIDILGNDTTKSVRVKLK